MEGAQLDEFLDSLPSSLRMKVVSHLEPDEVPTEPPPATSKPSRPRPPRSKPHQIGPGGLSAWQKVVVVVLVAPVLLLLLTVAMLGQGAKLLYENLFEYTKEKLT